VNRHLLLLTNSFPRGDNEPFVESEFMHLAVGGTSETVVDRMNSALLPAHPSPEAIADRILQYDPLGADRKRSHCEETFEMWSRAYDANTNFPAFARDLLSLGDATTRTPAAPTPARQPNRSDGTPP
jgi:hypothetical protein